MEEGVEGWKEKGEEEREVRRREGGRRSDVKHTVKKRSWPFANGWKKNRKWMRIHFSCIQDGLGGCRGMSTPLSLWCH